MTHSEFFNWLQGYLDNPGRPYATPYSDYEQYLQIIKDKMKTVQNTSNYQQPASFPLTGGTTTTTTTPIHLLKG